MAAPKKQRWGTSTLPLCASLHNFCSSLLHLRRLHAASQKRRCVALTAPAVAQADLRAVFARQLRAAADDVNDDRVSVRCVTCRHHPFRIVVTRAHIRQSRVVFHVPADAATAASAAGAASARHACPRQAQASGSFVRRNCVTVCAAPSPASINQTWPPQQLVMLGRSKRRSRFVLLPCDDASRDSVLQVQLMPLLSAAALRSCTNILAFIDTGRPVPLLVRSLSFVFTRAAQCPRNKNWWRQNSGTCTGCAGSSLIFPMAFTRPPLSSARQQQSACA